MLQGRDFSLTFNYRMLTDSLSFPDRFWTTFAQNRLP